jgi:hypothetical protein
MAEEPRIVEMQEDDWVSPEDMRLRAEEKARLQAEEDEAARLSGRTSRKDAAAASFSFPPGQWSTALSDAVLVACALYGCWLLVGHEAFSPYRARDSLLMAVAGLVLMALAAFFGTLRFAGLEVVAPVHDFLATMASAAGLPLFAFGALLAGEVHLSSHRLNGLLALVASAAIMAVTRGWGKAVSGLAAPAAVAAMALKGAALVAVRREAAAGLLLLLGVALAGIAGRFVAAGAKQQRHGPLRMLGVDVFHYLVALGLVALAHGIAAATRVDQTPVPLVLAWLPGMF